MQEVFITLRFNRVCLGAAKKRWHGKTIFAFDKDPAGAVMFMPAAWSAAMRYAAKLANRHQQDVQKIDWCPVVTGTPRADWRRTIVADSGAAMTLTHTHYALHEAFSPGHTVGIYAVLPDDITIEEFDRLLAIVGKYRGFSPFNNKSEKYGTFDVISIEPTGLGSHEV